MTRPAWEGFQLLLAAGRETVVPIQGTSMHPYLKRSDRLRLERVAPEALRLGDLMAFRRGDELVVHRMAGWVQRDGMTGLRQKGDHLRGFSVVRPEEVIGRVSHVLRGEGEIDLARPLARLRNRTLGFGAWAFCRALEITSGLKRAMRITR